MKRRAARELVLKVLFARDLGKVEPYTLLEQLAEEEKAGDSAIAFSRRLIEGVIFNQDNIDKTIREYAIEWDIDRMAAVDRNIMRLALFEMLYSPDVPKAVAVNEAVELAKIYGSEDSARFINGILGNVMNVIKERG